MPSPRDTAVEPDREAVAAFISTDADEPVVMINLLRYRATAVYPPDAPSGIDTSTCSGREAYQRYAAQATRKVAEVGGRVRFMGAVSTTLIGPAGEVWDDAILVEYPSRRAFIQMVSSPGYQREAVHRTAALEDSRLIATRPGGVDAL